MSPSTSGGLVDVARNRAAYQSSSIDDDHTAHLATDGSDVTYWECRPDGEQWISIDLGDVLPISSVTLHWGESYARAYRIETSCDGSRPARWNTVHATSTGSGHVEEVPLPSTKARHLRLIGNADEGRGFSIRQFQTWGEKRPPAAPVRAAMSTKERALLTNGWSLQSAMFTTAGGPEEISSARYVGENWLPAAVPATVLASYLSDGAIPDPFYGNEQSQISEDFFTRNDFWYRNSFEISPDCRGRRLWLVFDGINWKADVYLNGAKLGSVIRSRPPST